MSSEREGVVNHPVNSKKINQILVDLGEVIENAFKNEIKNRHPGDQANYESLEGYSADELLSIENLDYVCTPKGLENLGSQLVEPKLTDNKDSNEQGGEMCTNDLNKLTKSEKSLARKYHYVVQMKKAVEDGNNSNQNTNTKITLLKNYKDTLKQEQSLVSKMFNDVLDWFFDIFSEPRYHVSGLFASQSQNKEISQFNNVVHLVSMNGS